MDQHEVIETSDVEELEEIRALDEARRSEFRGYKRIKLFHSTEGEDSVSFLPTSSATETSFDDAAHFPPSSPSDRVSSIFSHTDGISSRAMSRFSTPDSPKSDPTETMMMVDTDEKETPPEDSQDPLLLKSPARRGPSSIPQSPSSPVIMNDSDHVSLEILGPTNVTSSRPHVRTPSPSPLQLPDHEINSQAINDDVDHLADGLLQFSPYKGRFSSPLPPSPPVTTKYPFRHTPSSSPPPRPLSSPSIPPEDPIIPPDPLENQPRYALRQRGARQLNPYLYDKAEYQNALKNNPDAIVKIRSPKRGEHRHEHYLEEGEESQQQEYDAAYDSGGGRLKQRVRTRSRSRGRASDEEQSDVVELGLPTDLSSSDDDEKREVNATRKEARRFEREQARKAREERVEAAREKRNAHQKKKSFPLSKRFLDGRPDKSGLVRSSPPNGSSRRATSVVSSHPDNDIEPVPRAGTSRRPRSMSPNSLVSEHDDNDIIDMHSDNDTGAPYPSSPAAHQFHAGDEPIVIDDDESDSDNGDVLRPSSPERTKEKARFEALSRMMPASMIDKLQKGNTLSRKRPSKPNRSEAAEFSGEDDGPLRPGKSRKKFSSNPGIRDIRGDTESSEEELRTPSESENESPLFASGSKTVRRRPRDRIPRHVSFQPSDLSDSGVGTGSEANISEDEIRTHLASRGLKNYKSGFADSLNDRMLAHTYNIVASGSRSKKSRPRTSSRKQAAKGQMRLDFDKHGGAGPSSHRSRSGGEVSHHVSKSHRHHPRENGSDVRVNDFPIDPAERRRAEFEMKKREAKNRRKGGVYVLPNEGTHIVSGQTRDPPRHRDRRRRNGGRRKQDAIIESGFHQALAPLLHRSSSTPPAPPDVVMDDEVLEPPATVNRSDAIDAGDFSVPLLPAGIIFAPSTYTGKGWLYELLNISSTPHPPPNFTAMGFNFGPTVDLIQLKSSLVDLCSRLLDIATNLPDPDNDDKIKQWDGLLHVACQMLTWHLSKANEDEAISLRNVAVAQVSRLVIKMREAAFTSSSIDLTILAVCWFAVELSVRLNYRLPVRKLPRIADDDILLGSVTLLVRYLLIYGLQRTMNSIVNQQHRLDGLSIEQRTAELWVCLIHTADRCRTDTDTDTGRPVGHPLWPIVQDVEADLVAVPKRHLDASESYWRTIFSLCALSQFSVHGLTTLVPKLPACWDIALSALQQIRLAADPVLDKQLLEGSLLQRDKYINTITSRCLQLRNRWQWRLTDAIPFLNHLADIFRSRKFAKLRSESCDFPAFMRKNDASLLLEHSHSDTAFAHFLKLIVQAAREDGATNHGPSLSPKVKKLLSIAIPVGSLSFPKSVLPSSLDPSMLINRLAATFVGLYLDHHHYSSRIAHARTYINFRESHHQIRYFVIRAWHYFVIYMVQEGLPLDEAIEWMTEMIQSLVQDSKTLLAIPCERPRAPTNEHEANRTIMNVQFVMSAVRIVMDTFKDRGSYPDPRLLVCLQQFPGSPHLHDTSTTLQVMKVVKSFLNARAVAIPPPRRPPVISPQEDSQQEEFGSFDVDLNDPDLLIATGDGEPVPHQTHDILASKFIGPMSWFLYRSLPKVIESRPVDFKPIVETWLGCVDLLGAAGTTSLKEHWSPYFSKTIETILDVIRDEWTRGHMELTVFLCLLKLNPMLYPEFQEKFMDNFFHSLTPSDVTIEPEYISLFLSIDGVRHWLLEGIPCQPTGKEYTISTEQYLELRIPIIRAVLHNIEKMLQSDADAQAKSDSIAHCARLFSAMRLCYGSLQSEVHFEEQTEEEAIVKAEGKARYVAFCRDVGEIFRSQPTIHSQERLGLWEAWFKGLDP